MPYFALRSIIRTSYLFFLYFLLYSPSNHAQISISLPSEGCLNCDTPATLTTGAGTGNPDVVNCGGTNFSVNGTYAIGTLLDGSNTIDIELNVTKAGSYSISSSSVNGYSFSANGNFTNTGSQTVSLIGSGTPVASGTDQFVIAYGSSLCTFSVTVGSAAPAYTIGTGSACSNANGNGNYTIGNNLDGTNTLTLDITVNALSSYVISTNTRNGYSFSKSGNFTTLGTQQITLTGTGSPIDCGTDVFRISGDITEAGTCTVFIDVEGRPSSVWADRNLGASRVATSMSDAASFGHYYQWGRGSDGHQFLNSSATSTIPDSPSSSDNPGHGSFIRIAELQYDSDWRFPHNNNLWQGVSGINNPCPAGMRLPTSAEFECEIKSWPSQDGAGGFASPNKWPTAGLRDCNALYFTTGPNTIGQAWTSTVGSDSGSGLAGIYQSNLAYVAGRAKCLGIPVRCIQD